MTRPYISRPVLPEMLAKFEAKLASIQRDPDECWPYSDSAVRQNWYGRISCGNNRINKADFHQVVAHRVSWVYFNGPLALNLVVMHQCDYKPCVNPAHLMPGTPGENIAEAYERGLQPRRKRRSSSREERAA